MKKLFLFTSALLFSVIVLLITTACKFNKQHPAAAKNNPGNSFAVMELFTSQGCNTCPPAEELLGKYAAQKNEQIIPLAFHVDYWNRLGWKDSFSTSDFSARQQRYAATLNSSVYTPQLIINGQNEMVGSDENAVAAAVKKAQSVSAATTITIHSQTIKDGQLSVKYTLSGQISNSNVLAMIVQDKAITKVNAGENNGATLTTYNVVRSFISISAKAAGDCILQIPAHVSIQNLSIVLLTQNTGSLKITGAVKKILQ